MIFKKLRTDPEIKKRFDQLADASIESSEKVRNLGLIIKGLKEQKKPVPKNSLIELKQLLVRDIEIYKELDKFIKDNYAELSKSYSKRGLDRILQECSRVVHNNSIFISSIEKDIASI